MRDDWSCPVESDAGPAPVAVGERLAGFGPACAEKHLPGLILGRHGDAPRQAQAAQVGEVGFAVLQGQRHRKIQVGGLHDLDQRLGFGDLLDNIKQSCRLEGAKARNQIRAAAVRNAGKVQAGERGFTLRRRFLHIPAEARHMLGEVVVFPKKRQGVV